MKHFLATYHIALLLLLGTLVVSPIRGQQISSKSGNTENWLKYAHKSYSEQDYYGAAHYFEKSLEIDSLDIEIWWYLAESHRLSFNYEKAQKAYEKLLELDEKRKYEDAIFYLAEMLKVQEYYEEASVYFGMYQEEASDRSSELYRRSKEEIKACVLAPVWKNKKQQWEIEHAPFGLNSFDAEFGPQFVNDSQLLFSALRFDTLETKKISSKNDIYKSKIFRASQLNDNWTSVALDNRINDSLTDNANPSLSPDGQQLYFTRCDASGCKIWRSVKTNNDWTTPEPLGPMVNEEKARTTHPHYVELPNGKAYLFFASDRSRSRGQMDIWYVEIKDNGEKIGRPKNAGRQVNTKSDEITPFYNPETQELYFSSVYHPGFGGFDIFKSAGEPGKFGEPQNLLYPINSSVNDMYYTYSNTLKKGALISNRSNGYALKGETCCNDIYFFRVPDSTISQDSVWIIPPEEDLNLKLSSVQFFPLSLYFDNDQPNPRTRVATTDKTYEETFTDYEKRRPQFRKNAPNKAEIDSFFVQNVDEGFAKLQMISDSLIQYLHRGYNLQLGIKGYTSPLGDSEYNDLLAERRIQSIENYFSAYKSGVLKNAIDSGRLKFTQIPFGEFFSGGIVEDDRKNQQKSVYSPEASEARKVEIIWVQQSLPGDSNAVIVFEKTTHNFGTLPQNAIVSNTFKFTNSGNSPLEIEAALPNCECIEIDYPPLPILPGESGEIRIQFNTSGRKGLQFHAIVVRTNAAIPEKKLFIRGMMEAETQKP